MIIDASSGAGVKTGFAHKDWVEKDLDSLGNVPRLKALSLSLQG